MLNGDTLGNKIGTTLYNAIPESAKQKMSEAEKKETKDSIIESWKTISNDLISYIKSNAVITVTIEDNTYSGTIS